MARESRSRTISTRCAASSKARASLSRRMVISQRASGFGRPRMVNEAGAANDRRRARPCRTARARRDRSKSTARAPFAVAPCHGGPYVRSTGLLRHCRCPSGCLPWLRSAFGCRPPPTQGRVSPGRENAPFVFLFACTFRILDIEWHVCRLGSIQPPPDRHSAGLRRAKLAEAKFFVTAYFRLRRHVCPHPVNARRYLSSIALNSWHFLIRDETRVPLDSSAQHARPFGRQMGTLG